MTQTGKMNEALARIKALSTKRRDKIARAKTHAFNRVQTDASASHADGLDEAATVIADVLAS